ncbi:MAG TPA: PIN domain-containing protein [Burkholderiales bacterium]|nr:PIN domain-containing protein [Burkholderiales bacterium]
MALDALAAIPNGATVVVDSAPLIYYFEDHPRFAARFAPLFDRLAAGELELVISSITLAEVLAGPLSAGNEVLTEQYRVALSEASGCAVHPVTASLAVTAARFRVKHRLKLPDAIQLATAVEASAFALITHDRNFRGVSDVRVIQ